MTTPTSPPSLVVGLVPIDDLRPDPANPRRISEDELDALERSLRQFGFVQPVLARREDRTVIGGHQRLVAARRLGPTSVPVTWLDVTVEQARLLGLALNKISGSWDEQLLARLLADLQAAPDVDLSLSGFDEDEIGDLFRKLEVREKREHVESFDLDEALEEARRAPRTKLGDLWVLGDHRLLCGDATSPADVARLLDGAEPKLLTTDPPYGVSLDGSWRDGVYNALGPAEKTYMRIDGQPAADDATQAPARAHGRTRGHRNTTLSGDTRVDWSEAFALVPSLQVGYVWHAGVQADEVAVGLKAIGFEIVAQVIWDKGLFAMGRSWYHWSHEPCWVVRKAGAKVPFRGSRDQATIWRVPSPKMIMGGSAEPRLDHPPRSRSSCTKPRSATTYGLAIPYTSPSAARAPRSSLPSGLAPAATRWRSTRSISRSRWPVGSGSAGRPRHDSMTRATTRREMLAPLLAPDPVAWANPGCATDLALLVLQRRRDPCAERIAIEVDRRRTPAERDAISQDQADALKSVIDAVLNGIGLTTEQRERAIEIAVRELRRVAGEDSG